MLGRTLGWLLLSAVAAFTQEAWKTPPDLIARVATAAPPPAVQVDPTGEFLLLSEADAQPTLSDLARPMLRLAGLRIDPTLRLPHGVRGATTLTLVSTRDARRIPIVLPKGARATAVSWAPRGGRFVFLMFTNDTAPQLWVCGVDGAARQLSDRTVNGAGGPAVMWFADGESLLARLVPAGFTAPSESRGVPSGPSVQETVGPAGPTRTYQDLLKNPHDEAVFEAYLQSEVVRIEVASGKSTLVLGADLWFGVSPSPDGHYLLVRRVERPFSYLLPVNSFPEVTEVYDAAGEQVRLIHRAPLQDRIPIEGVATGPRSVRWLEMSPAELFWVEALDDGDPKKVAAARDRLLSLAAPFSAEPRLICDLVHRYRGFEATEIPGLHLVSEYDRDRRWETTRLLRTDLPSQKPRVLFDRSTKDRYGDPGEPWRRLGPLGRRVVAVEDGRMYLTGRGASATGERPFLDAVHIETLEKTRLWQCAEGSYESVVTLLDRNAETLLIAREGPNSPPAWARRERSTGVEEVVYASVDPTPEFRGVTKTLLKYQRADGVPLSGTLYLPPGRKVGVRLPLFVWAYPEEFNDAQTAGQVSGSPLRFTFPRGSSHLLLALAGFAVLDDASMPVIGTPEKGNDAFLEQVVAGARAAIEHLDGLGIVDPKRVAVGGHSYGAFMTANLLAHSDLFRCGIARSGAYNRTLTPFGFQSERRTYWEAPETYAALSPFSHAPKINEPLLLIHGELDSNPGTFPMQSERLYQAVKGHGGTARLVMLPYEDHGYSARESTLQVQAEMIEWLNRHLASP